MIAIYIRTSTTEQNPENQLRECLSINRYGDYDLFSDQQSAWKDNIEREQFSKLKKGIKSNKYSHLIVWDLDRIYRNRKRLIQFFEYCKIYNCKVHSYRQKWLEDLHTIPEPFNEIMHGLMLQLMGWLAEDESNKKSQRVKAAVRKKGNQTVSYKGNRWGRKPVSTFKKNLVKKLNAEGKSIRNIAKEVNLSVGAVHKTVKEFNIENQQN